MPPINPDRWRVLSPFLDQALDIAVDERVAWLAAIAARDSALAADLQTILARQSEVRDRRFLECAVLESQPPAAGSLAGQVIGAYRLISHLGQGGTGSVWLAERCDGRFEGRAAVKLLNISLIGRAGEERFRREGNILARLRHPRIAHLIDAGVSPAGQPYLVLEHVDGQGIDEYCEDRVLPLEARLRLFLDVLDAVAHAHANLIVHRDLKPANVLVSTDGDVKLLDFGIAKLLERDASWGSGTTGGALTRDGGAALTPEFAAPEQLSGGVITIATDVYALGVLLYLLLTGRHPVRNSHGSPAALIKSILEEDAPRPSTVAPGKWNRAVRGDLDTIVAKAMKKIPGERYSSVTAMADDLRRMLRHEPISARPDTVGYRTARFVRRHSAGVASVTAGVALLSGLIAVHTIGLAAERDRAQREAAKAVKVSEMLMGLLTSADPYAPRDMSGEPTVRALLDAGARHVQADLTSDPDVQTQLLAAMGRTYRRLGLYEKAQQLLEQALVSGQRAFGPEHVRVAETLQSLGVVLADKGDYAGAAQRLEQALALQRKLLGGQHADVAVTLSELGRVYQDQGFNQRAEPVYREALEMRRRLLGEEHRETAVSLNDLGSVLRLNGDLPAAEILIRQSLAINLKTRGKDHPNTATTLHDLALIVAARGDYTTAESMLRQALATERKALGDRHAAVAATYNTLSRVLLDQGRHEEAISALENALRIAGSALGPDHPLVAIYTINLGAAQLARGTPAATAAAELLLRDGLRIRLLAPGVVPARRRTFPDNDWSIGGTKSLLGAALLAERRYDEAEGVLLEAERDLAASRDPRGDMIVTVRRLVMLYDSWGKPTKAAEYRARLHS
jgi:serine/threonine protein kinase/tetratricopeptide (TPR) repeat protein